MHEESQNVISNQWMPGEFYLSSKAALRDPRFDASGIDGYRAFRLLQIIQDLSTIPDWKFYRGDLAARLGNVSLSTLDRATRLLKEWGYLSVTAVTYRREIGSREIINVEYVWEIHRVTLENLHSRGIIEGASKVDATPAATFDAGGAAKVDEHSNKNKSNTNESKSKSTFGKVDGLKESLKERRLNLFYSLADTYELELDHAEALQCLRLMDTLQTTYGTRAIPKLVEALPRSGSLSEAMLELISSP